MVKVRLFGIFLIVFAISLLSVTALTIDYPEDESYGDNIIITEDDLDAGESAPITGAAIGTTGQIGIGVIIFIILVGIAYAIVKKKRENQDTTSISNSKKEVNPIWGEKKNPVMDIMGRRAGRGDPEIKDIKDMK